jgi:hypothetical protein
MNPMDHPTMESIWQVVRLKFDRLNQWRRPANRSKSLFYNSLRITPERLAPLASEGTAFAIYRARTERAQWFVLR